MLPGLAGIAGFSSSAAGGGGGPVTYLRTTLGNANWIAQSSGTGSNGRLIKITTPAGADTVISSVFASFVGFSAGVSLKALIVADSGGAPANGTPLAIGTATTPGSSADANFVVEMALASDQALTQATSYWIGYVPSASVSPRLADGNFSNVDGMQVAVTYATPSWDATSDVADGKTAIWTVAKQSATITGTHQQASSLLYASGSHMRMILPPHAIGDLIVLDTGQWFGTLPTISGYTQISDQQVSSFSGMRHRILTRTIDGTEDGTIAIPAPTSNDRTAVATVLRGGGAIEGTAHNTSSGTAITTAAVTTSGANRRVFNFCTFGQGNAGATNTQSADTWTDVYSLGTTFGADYSHSLSYKDVAVAGSSGTESRTVSNSFWHTTSWAKPDV